MQVTRRRTVRLLPAWLQHRLWEEISNLRSSTEFYRILDGPGASRVFQQLLNWYSNSQHPHRVRIHLEIEKEGRNKGGRDGREGGRDEREGGMEEREG